MSHFDPGLEAELLIQDFKNMYVQWGANRSPRTGIHASAILASEKEWCLRELVLLNLYPESAEQGELGPWDWKRSAIFENGWRLHQRWQDVFKKFGNVVYSPVTLEQMETTPSSWLKRIDGLVHAPELDLTHFDEERNLYFSPDAILSFGGERYIVEIKGIKEQSYNELTDDLEQACSACETVYKAREQVNLYMHMLKLSRGIILVENKNTCDFKLWVVEYEQERVMPYIERIYDVKGQTALAKLPGRQLPLQCCKSISDSRARKCPMRSKCFELQEESEEW